MDPGSEALLGSDKSVRTDDAEATLSGIDDTGADLDLREVLVDSWVDETTRSDEALCKDTLADARV